MRRIKKSIALLLSSVLILGLTACSKNDKEATTEKPKQEVASSHDTNSHYPVTITTYNYKKEPVEVTFEKAPENVIAVYQNSIETMLALGLEDKIKLASGLDHAVKDDYKEAFEKINYSEQFTPDKETVIMEQPDLILSWWSIFDDKRLGEVDYWHENNANTYMSLNSGAVESKTIENETTDILNLGKIFNVEEKAEAIVNEINNNIDNVKKKVEGQEKQTALIMEYMDGKIYTYGADTLGGDMVTKLGGEVSNPKGGNISEEDLINLNPDSIFVVYMDRTDEKVAKEEVNKVLNNPALKSLKTVKDNRVNSIALGEMYCSGVRTIDGLNTFIDGLYPNLDK